MPGRDAAFEAARPGGPSTIGAGGSLQAPRDHSLRAVRVASAVAVALLNQVVSSGTNFVLGALLVRQLTKEGFGAWGLTFSALLLALNFADAVVMTPMVVAIAQTAEQRTMDYVARAFAGTFVLAAVAAVPISVAMAVAFRATLSGPVLGLSAACGLAAFSFVLKESLVRICFALRRERTALFVNVAFGLTLLALAGSPIVRATSTAAAALDYFAGGCAATVVGLVALKLSPARLFVNPFRELARFFHGGRWYLGANLAYWLRVQAPTFVTTWMLGLSSVGVLTAGRLLVTPPIMANPALSQVTLPRLSRIATSADQAPRFRRCVAVVGLGLFSVATSYSAILWYGFDPITRVLLGQGHGVPRTVAAAWCVFVMVNALRNAAETGLKALSRARYILGVNVAATLVVFPVCVVGVRWLDVPGAALGVAIAELVVVALMLANLPRRGSVAGPE